MSRQSVTSSSEEVWRILKETQKNIKELSEDRKELQAERKKFQEEFHEGQKELQAIQKETERQIQKTGGRFNQRWGALVESLVEGKLVQIFQGRGIDITQTHTRSRAEWRKPEGSVERTEFDIIVANGTEVVAVEVKTVLTPTDVRDFLSNVRNFKKYFPRYKKEKVYGAAAYLTVEGKSDFLAEKEGLFLIRATGDSASLVNRKDFKPKIFS